MTERALRISEVNGWKPEDLGLDASALGRLVTKLDGLLQSMLTEHDDLAETWNGAGASAAATRVVNEQTTGSHISGKIDTIKALLTSGQTELRDARDFVLAKRKNFVDWGFEVDDRGIVSATEKVKQISAAGGDRADVMAAGLAVMAEAGRYTVEMLGALQHAQRVAKGVQSKIAAAKAELATLVSQQAPTKAVRDLGLVPGQTTGMTLPPGLLPDGVDPVASMVKLENGIPVTLTDKDGKTTTITPNPDGTLTIAQSVTGPDGSTTTTASTNGGPSTTTVSTPRADGSGIIDTTVNGPDGKQRRLQTVQNGGGKSTTYAVNDDGSPGAKISDSYPQNGGVTTDMYGENGAVERQWQRQDGFRAFEQYVQGSDGQPHLVGTSNSAGMQSALNQNGTITTTYPDGRTAETVQLTDGRIVTKFQDGSVLQYDPNSAAPEAPKQSIWDNVKSWSGTQWNGLVDSTQGTFQSHPLATGIGTGATATNVWATHGGESMANSAARAAGESAVNQIRVSQMLDAGTPGAGKAFVGAMDSATDASSKYNMANIMKSDAKLAGWPALVGVNAYVNWDDWAHHGKPGDEAIANAVGGIAGGWAGAAVGAQFGAWACAPVLPPFGSAFCAGVGAAAGGLGAGAAGAYFAEQPFK
ncbi:hypothetical protein REK76_24210 [Nocardia farcinica]|uniref:hypothetical protein n=1 Tax=Nocardia farcinica TaxID=37329 RepID=UPI001892D4C3|nr:hypothetical protein [Nocardia farcinica]MBF6069305.1 hypothetical protein [Nocardia farcinica]